MKKTSKIKIIMMALVMSFSLVFGLIMFNSPVKTVKAAEPATFEMLGMSIRYDAAEGEDGIRFGVKLDKTTYDALIADDNAVAGILVTPTDRIDGASLNIWTAAASQARYGVLYNGASGTNYWTVDEDYATGIVYLHGFPSASYNRPITAIAYIDWNNDCEAATVNHSDSVEASMADVALAVIDDYNDSNVYETTAAQAEKLDGYLLNYNVNFIDAYGNVSTQSVKFGSDFDIHADPAARKGYVFEGWALKTGESTYNSPAAITDTTVKYARTYKSVFSTTGSTFEKPALGGSNPKYVADEENISKTVNPATGDLSLSGAYYMQDAVVDNGADFMVSMTFTAVSGAEYVFLITDDLENGRGRITFRSDNKFCIYNYTSGDYRDSTWHWYDAIEGRSNSASALSAGSVYTLTLVHKNGEYVVFINNTKAVTFAETEELKSEWNNKSDPVKHVTDIVGDGENVYLGIGCVGKEITVTNWGYSTDAEDISAFVPDPAPVLTFVKPAMGSARNEAQAQGATISDGTLTMKGEYFMDGATVENGSDFLVQVTFTAASGFSEYGFLLTDDLAYGRGRIQYRSNNKFYVYNYTSGNYGGFTWAWYDSLEDQENKAGSITAGNEYTMTLVHKKGKYTVFINGTEAYSVSETANLTTWGKTNGQKVQDAFGRGDVLYLGFCSTNATTTFTDWRYSIDPEVIATYVPD